MVRKSVRVSKPIQVVFPATGSAIGVSAAANAGTATASIGGGGGGTTPLFRISHQSTSGGGTTYPIEYGTDLGSSGNLSVYSDFLGAENGTNVWNWAHVGDGSGWNGRNYMRYTRWADENGDPFCGFFFSASTVAPPGGWYAKLQASPMFMRWRMRVVSSLTLSGLNNAASMKWSIVGGPGLADGTDRMIQFFERATDGTYGTGSDDDTEMTVRLGAGVGSAWAGATMPVGEWVHIQIGWRYTDAGTPYQKVWINNNNEGSPDAVRTDFSGNPGSTWNAPDIWDAIHWGDIVSTNSYTGTTFIADFMDMEMDDAFDSSWAP